MRRTVARPMPVPSNSSDPWRRWKTPNSLSAYCIFEEQDRSVGDLTQDRPVQGLAAAQLRLGALPVVGLPVEEEARDADEQARERRQHGEDLVGVGHQAGVLGETEGAAVGVGADRGQDGERGDKGDDDPGAQRAQRDGGIWHRPPSAARRLSGPEQGFSSRFVARSMALQTRFLIRMRARARTVPVGSMYTSCAFGQTGRP